MNTAEAASLPSPCPPPPPPHPSPHSPPAPQNHPPPPANNGPHPTPHVPPPPLPASPPHPPPVLPPAPQNHPPSAADKGPHPILHVPLPPPPPPPPPSPPHPSPDSPPAPQNHPPPPPAANNGPHPILHVPPPPPPPRPEWISLFMNFFFTAVSFSIQSNKASTTSSSHNQLPISFQIAALGMVFSLAAFGVSKYMPAGHDLGARVQVQLENIGIFCGVTGFFIDITPCFALCLKIISWTVYALSLMAIIISRNFNIFRQ